MAELERLNVQSLVVLGGTSAVTDAVLASLRVALPAVAVARVAGADRYATAAKLARTVPPGAAASIVVAPGNAFAAALVAAPAAARAHAPLLLVDTQPSPATAAELARRGVRQLLAVGDLNDAATSAVLLAAAPSKPAPLTGAASAVRTAEAQLGKDYLLGAAGPTAYDCSGLTLTAWAAAGVHLPHNAEAQAYAVTGIPFTALQPGDLLFYGAPITHVGIYQGDDTMIEAAHSGAPVRTAVIWRNDLIAAGRPTSP
jgi:cell wall-associated NlpC family hydrolase